MACTIPQKAFTFHKVRGGNKKVPFDVEKDMSLGKENKNAGELWRK